MSKVCPCTGSTRLWKHAGEVGGPREAEGHRGAEWAAPRGRECRLCSLGKEGMLQVSEQGQIRCVHGMARGIWVRATG